MAYISSQFDDEIVRLLRNGAVGLLPSDTIYGLSCMALNRPAVERLQILKRRPAAKPFIVLIAELSQLNKLGITRDSDTPAFSYWPGRLTVILKAPQARKWLYKNEPSLAVRQPGNLKLRNLIAKTGPLISTSANLSGERPATSAKAALSYFGDSLDFYIDAGEMVGEPSTIVRPLSDKLKIIRQGEVNIKKEDLA